MWGAVMGGQDQSLCVHLGGPILQDLERRWDTVLEEKNELGAGLLERAQRAVCPRTGERQEKHKLHSVWPAASCPH